MGFFNKFFNEDKESLQMDGYVVEPFDSTKLEKTEVYYVHQEDKDLSKAVDSEHWDALSPDAQKVLTEKGFYRK